MEEYEKEQRKQNLTFAQKLILDELFPKWFILLIALIFLILGGFSHFFEFLVLYVVFKDKNKSVLTAMLNLLVDKAIERTGNKPDSETPIFTISYSSITSKLKPFNARELEIKTTVNKIPKISRKDNNIFQKWKSKTLEKLKDLNPSPKNAFFPIYPTKNLSVKLKSTAHCQNLSLSQSPQLEQELKQIKTSFVVQKKKTKSKAYSLQESPSKQSPMKSVYLQYKDENRQKKKKIVTLSNFYQKKLMQNQISKTIESSQNHKSESSEQEESRIIRPKKNVSFFNTIQYKTVPKEEIRHYKYDELDHSKRLILSRVDNSFVRTAKESSKVEYNIFDSTITAIRVTKFCDIKREQIPQGHRSGPNTVSVRKVYTEKRSRKIMKEFTDEDPQNLGVNFNNYRPWSPIKTNPLFINEDELLFEQSRTFNIFSSLQQVPGDRS